MEKEDLPHYTPFDDQTLHRHRQKQRRRQIFKCILLALATYTIYLHFHPKPLYTRVDSSTTKALSIEKLHSDYAQCSKLRHKPQDPGSQGPRSRNARWNGGNATLIRNTTIWTGEPVDGEYVWQAGDVLLEYGLISRVASHLSDDELPEGSVVRDGSGKMLTAGIIDMHSHAGDSPLPETRGGSDVNEMSSDTTPYVRSLDAINPLDPQLRVIKSGGVTTSLVLPGSGNVCFRDVGSCWSLGTSADFIDCRILVVKLSSSSMLLGNRTVDLSLVQKMCWLIRIAIGGT